MRDRKAPWWLVLALGVVLVGLGVWLLAAPVRSLSVLVWLVAAGLVVSGVVEVVTAGDSNRPWLSRLLGVVWALIGVLVAAWPGIKVLTLAIAAGVTLVVGGGVKLATAVFGGGDDRLIPGIGGVTHVIVGFSR